MHFEWNKCRCKDFPPSLSFSDFRSLMSRQKALYLVPWRYSRFMWQWTKRREKLVLHQWKTKFFQREDLTNRMLPERIVSWNVVVIQARPTVWIPTHALNQIVILIILWLWMRINMNAELYHLVWKITCSIQSQLFYSGELSFIISL